MTGAVVLRDVGEADLAIFFSQQLDPIANCMAAFIGRDPADRNAFMAHWQRIIHDDSVTIKTVVWNGQVAGYVLKHEQFGDPEISYWIGSEFWGKGIATSALRQVLDELTMRPLYAHVAKDNIGSIRVLEKCGFSVYGHDAAFANARGELTEEVLLRLA